MSNFFKAALAACLGAGAVLSGPALATTPIEDFVKHAIFSSAKISPNGEYLALGVDLGDQDVLTVMRTDDLSLVNINRLPNEKSVGSFHWVSPDRLLFNAIRKQGGYAQPFNTGEWYGVNADGTQPRPLIHYGTRGATERSRAVGNEVFSFVDTIPGDERRVVMEGRFPRSVEGAGSQVVTLDTLSGRRQMIARAPKANCSISLGADRTAQFAVCSSSRDEQGNYDERTELYRMEDNRWSLVSASASAGKHLWVVRTAPDGTVYALESDDSGPNTIGTLNTDTGGFDPLFHDDVADVQRMIWSTDERSLIAVVTEAGVPQVALIDENHPDAELYAALAASFPGEMVDFASHTDDGNLIVVSVYSDTNPGELYLYDRAAGQARFLMQGRPWLDKSQMASTRPFSFTARDGQLVYGYLTIPNGSDGRNLPMIVNPHGGPIGPRDSWRFNSESQLLASRGYAVLKVNFRGSGGYGRAFQDAGHQQWADGIQNDIIDATRWAIEQGHADSERICIYGGSFGGYSALMAPIQAPGLYKCTFGYVGVYDLDMMFKRGDIPETESGLRYLRRTLGTSSSKWTQDSPARRADEINIPVYLAAGARDRRTPPEQTEEMNRALIEAGNPPKGMIIQSGEMHGFYDEENNLNLYTEMLQFFSRHIGGASAIADD